MGKREEEKEEVTMTTKKKRKEKGKDNERTLGLNHSHRGCGTPREQSLCSHLRDCLSLTTFFSHFEQCLTP